MSATSRLSEVRRLLRRGALREAELAAQRALEGGADPVAGHALLGAVYLEQQRPVLAMRAASTAVRLDPDHEPAYRHLARAHQLLGQRQAALAALWTGIERCPGSLPCYLEAAALLRESGSLDEAVGLLDLAASRMPRAVGELDHARLELLLAERQWDEAAECAAVILAGQPDDVRALEACSTAEYHRGDLPAAIAATRRLLGMAPDLDDYALRLAMLYRAAGDLEPAVGWYESLAASGQTASTREAAQAGLAACDAGQLPAVLVMVSEAGSFAREFRADPAAATRARGIFLSTRGLTELVQMLAQTIAPEAGPTPLH